jgi:ATP-dependent helicase HrpA
MTDGILLAETQTDPLLKAYDTLIIDEAHERSLNIDFLLGYLRQILPRRPDLKIIVTSATIDAERFAAHFASKPRAGAGDHGVGPHVSGRAALPAVRGKPRLRPERRDRRRGGRTLAWAMGPRASARAWGRTATSWCSCRVSARSARPPTTCASTWPPAGAAQCRGAAAVRAPVPGRAGPHLRQPHGQRRIVLATNVAETSLTVPGIRFVIDAGTARVKRYSFRSKVEQLLVEPISQAAANQRAGRCGRVANGICIRLYDAAGLRQRPRFTDPEILRSSLAGVILRMKSLHLGVWRTSRSSSAPQARAIADGYQLLAELGAVDDANELTPIGKSWPACRWIRGSGA